MFSKTYNHVTFFNDEGMKDTEKVVYGRVTEAFKTGEKNKDGKDIYEHEVWNARFCGKARAKAEGLADKTRITLTEWNARISYNEEKKKSYPYILVTDFEIRESSGK